MMVLEGEEERAVGFSPEFERNDIGFEGRVGGSDLMEVVENLLSASRNSESVIER